MSEFIKILKILILIIKSIFRSLFLNDQDSKNLLTSLYLKEIYSTSKIKLISIDPSNLDWITLSARTLLPTDLKMSQRLTLQTPVELATLLSLLKKKNPAKIFEFGIMYGGSLLHFFLNTQSHVTIDSIDINLDNLNDEIAKIIKNNPRISVHQGDSLLFNELPFQESMDFIFIDGNHDYEFVRNDSLKALNMLSPEGIIVWDDYSKHFPGVYRYINELSKTHPGLAQIKGTSLVVLGYRQSSN